MKVLLHSNAPWIGSGYGTQCAAIARHIVDAGHKVAISTNWGHYGSVMRTPLWPEGPPITVYPSGPDDAGSSVIVGHVAESKPDIVMTLYDAVGMESAAPGGNRGPGWGRFGFRWVPYAMVDDGPPLASYHEDTLKGAREVLCLTRFAQSQLTPLGLPLHYLPHTIDTEVMAPGDKEQARKDLGLPTDKFLVLFCGEWEGWPGRKGIMETVEAFARLGDDVGWGNVAIMIQSKPMVEAPPMTLLQLRERFGIPKGSWYQETTHHSIVGRSRAHMAKLYQAADVVCLPSRAEAFGLTSVEAEACGTLAVTTDAHASAEVSCSPPACRVAPRGRLLSWKLSHWATIDAEDVYRALTHVHLLTPEQRSAMGYEAHLEVTKRFSREANQLRWTSALDAMERRLAPSLQGVVTSWGPGPKRVRVIVPTVDRDALELKNLAEMFKPHDCVIVSDPKKRGFPVAINSGARHCEAADPDWILVWNDDCVPDNSMMHELLRAAAEHQLDLVAPVITQVDEEGARPEFGWELFWGGTRSFSEPWADGPVLHLRANLYQSLFMVKRPAWEYLGGLDERYAPGYYEDVDFTRRLIACGYRAAVCVTAKCLHSGGSTFKKHFTERELEDLSARNRAFFEWKYNL